MSKYETLDRLLEMNNGYLRTLDVIQVGIPKPYLARYVKEKELERVAHGLYMSEDAWQDPMYVLQVRYAQAVFSHETASYLLNLADREPLEYVITLKAGANTAGLTGQGVKVYKVKEDLFTIGIMQTQSPAGHSLRIYNAERTLCDLIRSRKNIEIQDLQTVIREYVRKAD